MLSIIFLGRLVRVLDKDLRDHLLFARFGDWSLVLWILVGFLFVANVLLFFLAGLLLGYLVKYLVFNATALHG